MRRKSRAEGPYAALIYNRGTNATSRARPLPPSHPAESSAADNDTHNNFRSIFRSRFLNSSAAKIRISRVQKQIYLRFCRGEVSKTKSKIQISEGKPKLVWVLLKRSLLFADSGICDIYLRRLWGAHQRCEPPKITPLRGAVVRAATCGDRDVSIRERQRASAAGGCGPRDSDESPSFLSMLFIRYLLCGQKVTEKPPR